MSAIRGAKRSRNVVLGLLGVLLGLLLTGWHWQTRTGAEPSRQFPEKKGSERRIVSARERELPANEDTPRAAQLRGLIRDQRANPIAQASVCLRNEERLDECFTAHCIVTDASGRFVFSRTFEEARVVAAAAGYLPESAVADFDALGSELVITLGPAIGNVSGKVVDATGGPVAGSLVSVRRPYELAGSVVQSNAQGEFSLGFADGEVEISAQPEFYSRARVLTTAPVSGVVLVVTAASSIVGRVISAESGQPIADIRVVATAESGPDAEPASIRSGADGSFELKGLSAGRYQLAAIGPRARSLAMGVNVGVGEASASVLLMARSSVELNGTLLVNGEPCADGSVEFSGPAQVSAEVALGGAVQAEGLLPGRYRVAVECSGGLTRVETLEVANLPLTRQWDLSTGLAIRGTVRDYSGAPVGGASVVASSSAGSPSSSSTCTSDDTGLFSCGGLSRGTYEVSVVQSEQGSSDPVRVAVDAGSSPNTVLRVAASGTIRATFIGLQPGAAPPEVIAKGAVPLPLQGRRAGQDFVFPGVRLGQYRVYVGAVDDSAASASAEVQRAGQEVVVSLRAPKLRTIAGRVVDGDGLPALDAWVRATPSDPLQQAGDSSPVLTDEHGAFVIAGLTGTRYDLSATSTQGDGAVASAEPGSVPALIRLARPAGLTVNLRNATGDPISVFALSYSRDDVETTRVSAEGGLALLTRLPAGTYRLEATAESGQATDTVTLTPGAQRSVTLVVSSSKRAESDKFADTQGAEVASEPANRSSQ